MQQGDPVPLLGDVMAPSGIRFERQEECPCMMEGTRPGLTLPEAAQAGDRCNKAALGGICKRNMWRFADRHLPNIWGGARVCRHALVSAKIRVSKTQNREIVMPS